MKGQKHGLDDRDNCNTRSCGAGWVVRPAREAERIKDNTGNRLSECELWFQRRTMLHEAEKRPGWNILIVMLDSTGDRVLPGSPGIQVLVPGM